MNTRLAGCVLVDSQGRIGLLHRNKAGFTQWELPGGKVEPGETDEATALRELSEELGVKVSIRKRLGEASFSEARGTFDYVWFMADVTEGIPAVSEKQTFDDFAFFSIDELANLKLSGNMQQLCPLLQSGKISLR